VSKTQLIFARSVFCVASLMTAYWSHAGAVVVVSAKSPVSSLTKEQSSEIFMGKATSFPGGGAATPLDQPESSPLRDEFYTKVTGKSASQAKSYWSKLSFTGKGTPPKEGHNSADIKKQIADNPNLVGYIENSAVDSSVKVLFAVQ
jgi:ABC-type phosphate transport system substrate-binding protein